MIRTYSHRVDVLRNGAVVTQLKAVGAPSIYCDSTADIKCSLSGTFAYNPIVDYLNDELKVWQIINGVEHPAGVFCIGTYNDDYDADGHHTVKIEAYDRSFLLQQTRTEGIYHIDAGVNYGTAIEQLLTAAGISLYIITPTSCTLATAREDWDVGTDYLTIANTLLAEINYNPIWFNADGYAILEPYAAPDATKIDHTYDGTTELSVLLPDCSAETDIFDKPNVFIVVCSNPDLSAPLMATAENTNPVSTLSTFKRGRRIAKVFPVDNIASQDELDAYAQRLCFDSMLSSEVVDVKTALMPGHGVLDTIAIKHPKIQGIFQELAWSLTLGPGQAMTHKLRRVIIV